VVVSCAYSRGCGSTSLHCLSRKFGSVEVWFLGKAGGGRHFTICEKLTEIRIPLNKSGRSGKLS
jgi:hypothetical protein